MGKRKNTIVKEEDPILRKKVKVNPKIGKKNKKQ